MYEDEGMTVYQGYVELAVEAECPLCGRWTWTMSGALPAHYSDVAIGGVRASCLASGMPLDEAQDLALALAKAAHP